MVTQNELKDIFAYDEASGVFTNLLNGTGTRRKGGIAGRLTNQGYVSIKINGKPYGAHRLAFLYIKGVLPEFIDHINHCRSDNRWCNLREVSHHENCKNRKLGKNNTSGQMGVSWKSKRNRWIAWISIDKKQVHLGSFINYHEAVNVRKLAEVTYGYHDNHGNKE